LVKRQHSEIFLGLVMQTWWNAVRRLRSLTPATIDNSEIDTVSSRCSRTNSSVRLTIELGDRKSSFGSPIAARRRQHSSAP
jgi:hypothetical protein